MSVIEVFKEAVMIELLGNESLKNLRSRSLEIQSKCADYYVRVEPSSFRYDNQGEIVFSTDSGVKRLALTDYSFGQLCTKLGVPSRYIEKCISSGRLDLASDNMNSWIEDYGRNLLIREYDGNARGILSGRYSVCDTPQILDVLDSIDLKNYDVKESFLSAERLHLRLISKEMLPINDEDLFVGLFVDSSDVGRSTLTVNFGLYKQVCTNGLIVCKSGGSLFKQKHLGITSEEFYNGLVASLGNLEQVTEEIVDYVNKSSKTAIEVDYLEKVMSQTNLSEENWGKVIDLMNNRYSDTKWGMINGITEVAQEFTLERRLELEKFAGNLLVA